jgi:hypothetical protein
MKGPFITPFFFLLAGCALGQQAAPAKSERVLSASEVIEQIKANVGVP